MLEYCDIIAKFKKNLRNIVKEIWRSMKQVKFQKKIL